MPHVRLRVGFRAATCSESVGVLADGHLIDQEIKNPPLDGLESPFWCHDDAMAAAAFWDGEADVIEESVALAVNGIEAQFLDADVQRGGHIVLRFPHRQAESPQLLLIVNEITQLSIPRAHRAGEETRRFVLAHHFLALPESCFLWQQAWITPGTAQVAFLQRGAAGIDHFLSDRDIVTIDSQP